MSCSTVVISLLVLATAGFSSAVSPAFVWSNYKSLSPSKSSYEVVEGSDALISLLLAARGKAVSPYIDSISEQPDYVVAYFGRQADSGVFPQSGFTAGPLQPLVDSSESWLSFQHADDNVASSSASIQQALAEAEVEAKVFGCNDSPASLSAAEAMEQYLKENTEARVVIICSGAEDSAAELAEVLSLNQMLQKGEQKYVALYAAEGASSFPKARILPEASPNLTCGEVCQTQVAWFQVILAAGVLLIALLSGLSCLYLLDTPTRFEVPKEGTTAASS